MKVAILGYGLQGKSAYRYYRAKNAEITICDMNEELAEELPSDVSYQLGVDYLLGLHEFDVIVRSPRLHPKDILVANASHPEVMKKITSATNLFFEEIETPVIGVTGTKGKGTTVLIIKEVLEHAGYSVVVGGNIGVSPLDVLDESKTADYIVLELSNFQTIDMNYSPHISICLPITPEHLDWHTDYEEYVDAKAQMFVNQGDGDLSIYSLDNADSRKAASKSPART